MKVHRWSDIKRKTMTATEIAESRKAAEKTVLELNLRAVRQLAGKTQTQVAKATAMAQGHLSLFERRRDHRLSTLRRYVKALGGDLEVIARFNDKTVKLKGL